MKKALKIISLLLILLFLSSCNQIGKVSIKLYLNDETEYKTVELSRKDGYLEIPDIEDGKIFVSWTDGELDYAGFDIPLKDTTLYLKTERIEDVFDFGLVLEGQETFSICGYTGEAKYLKIPGEFNGKTINAIMTEAFNNLDLIEIYIPNTVTNVYSNAINNLDNLTKVEFYGTDYGIAEKNIAASKFESYLSEHSDVCQILSEDEDGRVIYSEDCLYTDSFRTESTYIQNVEYYNYIVHYENIDDLPNYNQQIYDYAISNCPNLETVVMPDGNFIPASMFQNTPKLAHIEFINNPIYTVKDEVIYTTDFKTLVYYPPGLTQKTFTVPETVESIRNAFNENYYLKKIVILEHVQYIDNNAFNHLISLQEFNVSDENEYFYSNDGVLFFENESDIYLKKYPEAKEGLSYVLPENVTVLDNSAFSYNQNLEEIVLNNGLTVILDYAFKSAEKLLVIDIPETVLMINNFIIDDTNIHTMIIRRSIVDYDQITNVGSDLFNEGKEEFTIYFPDDSLSEYRLDSKWSHFIGYSERYSEYHPE